MLSLTAAEIEERAKIRDRTTRLNRPPTRSRTRRISHRRWGRAHIQHQIRSDRTQSSAKIRRPTWSCNCAAPRLPWSRGVAENKVLLDLRSGPPRRPCRPCCSPSENYSINRRFNNDRHCIITARFRFYEAATLTPTGALLAPETSFPLDARSNFQHVPLCDPTQPYCRARRLLWLALRCRTGVAVQNAACSSRATASSCCLGQFLFRPSPCGVFAGLWPDDQ